MSDLSPLLPVDVQLRADAALGAAWRRCEAALSEGWAVRITTCNCSKEDAGYWHVSAGGDLRNDPEVYEEGRPAEALSAMAATLESRP